MKNTILFSIITILFLIGNPSTIQAQTDKELLADLAAEEQEAINALVLYPAETRQTILAATLYPEALIKMESLQSRTQLAFRERMESLPQKSQEVIWDLTRYPGLIHDLALLQVGEKTSIEKVLEKYPKVIHQRAIDAASNHDLPLMVVDKLNQASESAFQSILEDYPIEVQKNLRALVELPEVLTILTENIRLTLLVGHVYQKEPDWILHKADSLNLEVARQNAQEVEDWKASLENDPEAMEEFSAAVETYNESYDYDDAYYQDYREETIEEETRDRVIVHNYYDYNYPYWLGYPYWYEYPRWRYYPSWYDWGYYYYPNRPMIIIGIPSFHFTYWYFNHPHHHRHHPHLSAHFVRHYRGHRHSRSSVSRTVNTWKHNNREVISDSWLKDDGRLPSRFKEYGEFEASREKYNRTHPKQKMSQKEYLSRKKKKFPTITKSEKEQRTKMEYQKRPVTKKPVKTRNPKPSIQKPKTKNPITKKPTKPKTDRPINPKTKKPVTKKPKTVFPKTTTPKKKSPSKVNRGRDYHKNTWENSKKKTSRTPSTRKRTIKQPKTNKKPKTSKKSKKPSRGN